MRIILSKDAQRQYNRLPKSEQRKIFKKLLGLENNPYSGKKLTGEFEGLWTIRAWPYRILYEVNIKNKRVEIHKIAHRQAAYK